MFGKRLLKDTMFTHRATSPFHQWSSSFVGSLLLLLAGDVEVNPGPGNAGYEAVKNCTGKLTSALAYNVLVLSQHLLEKSLISQATMDHVLLQSKTNREKAALVVNNVTEEVRCEEKQFNLLIEVLISAANDLGLHNNIVNQLLESYEFHKPKAAQGHGTRQAGNSKQQQSLHDDCGTQNGSKRVRKRSRSDTEFDLEGRTVASPSPKKACHPVDARINGIARHHNISLQKIDSPIFSAPFLPISKEIVAWRGYASYLGLSKQDIKHIETHHDTSLAHSQSLMMLQEWMKQFPESHFRALLRACLDVESNASLVGKICRILASPQYVPDFEKSATSATRTLDGVKEANKGPAQINCQESFRYFCEPPALQGLVTTRAKAKVPGKAARAPVATSKLWTGKKHEVLNVFFLNPEELDRYHPKINEDNIIDRANIWNTKNSALPEFTQTKRLRDADIIVKIGDDNWSLVGTDARKVTRTTDLNKQEPTMMLRFLDSNDAYNKHIIIHEFGHALGLEHEHQRSKFWLHAKDFINLETMRLELGDAVMPNYEECPDYTVDYEREGSADYDPHSIMHYWFAVGWINNTAYHSKEGIIEDHKQGVLNEDQERVLLGIHTRHRCLADRPSDTDVTFLVNCYKKKRKLQKKSLISKIAGLFGLSGSPAPVEGTDDVADKNELKTQIKKTMERDRGNSAQVKKETDPSNDDEDENDDERDFSRRKEVTHSQDVSMSASATAMNKTLKIGVFGTTNSGKSTTINAILGGRYLPSRSGPTSKCVVCVKHDQKPQHDNPDVLFDRAHSNPKSTECFGRKEIHKQLKALNSECETVRVKYKEPVLSFPLPFLCGELSCHDLELHDIPGSAEEKGTPIYEDIKRACQKMDQLFLVISQDTYKQSQVLKSIAPLLKRPGQAGELKPCYVLLNKLDLFSADREDSDDDDPECSDIDKAKKIIINEFALPQERIIECSSKLAFTSRKWRADPDVVTTDNYSEFRAIVCRIKPEYKSEADKKDAAKVSLKEKVLWLSEVMEKESNIKVIEEKILDSLNRH